jgi:hypothetical protein
MKLGRRALLIGGSEAGSLLGLDGEVEGGALPDLALHPDRPAHQLAQPLADRKAQARAAIPAGGRGVDLAEGFEQAAQLVI